MMRLAASCGLPAVDVDITFTSITMCCHRGMVAPPVTTMRLVRYRTTDLTRLADGDPDRAAGGAGADGGARGGGGAGRGGRRAAPLPALGGDRWVGRGRPRRSRCCSAAPPVIALAAFVITAFIDRLGRRLGRWGFAPFFLQLVGARGRHGLHRSGCSPPGALPPGTEPSLVIAASITVLLSGLSVVGTVKDAISTYYVTAAGRAAEIALLTAGLLTGVVLGLKLGLWFGLTLDPAEPLAADFAQFGISTFAAATAAGMFALAGYAPMRSLLAAGLAGGVGWAVYGALTQFADFGPVVATGIAATVVGLATGLSRRGTGVHSHVITLAGIIPLLPGLTAYRGFYQLAVEGVADGLVTVTLALAIGLALAAGVALGDFIARPGPTRVERLAEPA